MACQMKRPLANLIYITKETHHGRPGAQRRQPAVEFELGVHSFVCSLRALAPTFFLLTPAKLHMHMHPCGRLVFGGRGGGVN